MSVLSCRRRRDPFADNLCVPTKFGERSVRPGARASVSPRQPARAIVCSETDPFQQSADQEISESVGHEPATMKQFRVQTWQPFAVAGHGRRAISRVTESSLLAKHVLLGRRESRASRVQISQGSRKGEAASDSTTGSIPISPAQAADSAELEASHPTSTAVSSRAIASVGSRR